MQYKRTKKLRYNVISCPFKIFVKYLYKMIQCLCVHLSLERSLSLYYSNVNFVDLFILLANQKISCACFAYRKFRAFILSHVLCCLLPSSAGKCQLTVYKNAKVSLHVLFHTPLQIIQRILKFTAAALITSMLFPMQLSYAIIPEK